MLTVSTVNPIGTTARPAHDSSPDLYCLCHFDDSFNMEHWLLPELSDITHQNRTNMSTGEWPALEELLQARASEREYQDAA